MGEFGGVTDFAAKAAENAARIAAAMSVFEHGVQEIAAPTIEAASEIVRWHLYEAKRVIGATAVARPVADAMLLEAWMKKPTANGSSRRVVSPRDVLSLGPAPLRDKKRRDEAGTILLEKHRILETRELRRRWMLHPKLW